MNFQDMKNSLRVLLLCLLCVAGSFSPLHAQDPTLEIYQVRVSAGHGTAVVVKDKTMKERLLIADNLAILKVKVASPTGASSFTTPYTITLEKDAYDINAALGVNYDGSGLSTAGAGGLEAELLSKSGALSAGTPATSTLTERVFEVAVTRDFDPASQTDLATAIKTALEALVSPTDVQLYDQIIAKVEVEDLFIAKKGSSATEVDTKIRSFNFKVENGSQSINYDNAALLFPQDKVYKAIIIDTGIRPEDGTLMAKTIMYKAATKLNAVFITHSDQDHWGGLGLGFSSVTQNYTSNTTDGLEKYLIADKIIGNGTNKVAFYYPSTPAMPNAQYANVSAELGKTFYTYVRNLISALPGVTEGEQSNAAGNNSRAAFSYQHWFPNADFILYSNGGDEMKLSTLMANCILRSKWGGSVDYSGFTAATVGTGANERDLQGCAGFDGVPSNNKSAVAKISWSKTGITKPFEFLVQGDLESGSKSGNIAYTKEFFLDKLWSGNDLITNWNTAGSQAAQQIARGGRAIPAELGIRVPRNTPFNDTFTIQGIERKGLKEGDNKYGTVTSASLGVRAAGTVAPEPVSQNLDQAVAYPDNGRFRLAAAIGNDVCLALVPHHGANTSNLWFKAKNVLYGTHQGGGGKWAHPKLTNVQAVEANVRADNYFFTWTDWEGGTIAKIRDVIGSPITNNAYTLKDDGALENANQQYWVFRVQDGLNSIEVSNGSVASKGDAVTQIINNPTDRIFNCN